MTDPPEDGSTLRVLTWNVRRLKDDRSAVVAILRAAEPDVLALQEAPKLFPGRWLSWLARAAGLRWVAGGYTSACSAILVSSRVECSDPVSVRLPRGRPLAQARGLALVTVRVPGAAAIRIGCTHLGLDEAERIRHARLIRDRLAATGGPAVLAGDFNEPPSGPAWRALQSVVTDPAPTAGVTFSVARPRHRIDAILTGPDVETVEYGQWRPDPDLLSRATDHLPVLSRLRPTPS